MLIGTAKSGTPCRVMQFTLPADASAFSLVRRFVREMGRSMSLSVEKISSLQVAVTRAMDAALADCGDANAEYLVVQIDTIANEIRVEICCRQKLFSTGEFLSRC